MDKYSRYYGIMIFAGILLVTILIGYQLLSPAINGLNSSRSQLESKQIEVEKLKNNEKTIKRKLAQMQSSMISVQKKVYHPIDSDLGNDTLFFTLYNDVIEMVHANSIKIKSMDYSYNPESDAFVKAGNDIYFVCEINMELVSNYTNLGKLIEDIVQYPYYIKINRIETKPYAKDKKILLSNVSLRLYAHTAPEEDVTDNPLKVAQ